MKLLCLILSVYVLMLSVKPCCADDDCRSKTSTSQQITDKAPLQGNECPGCSPFFTCGSCTGFIITRPIVHISVPIAETAATQYSGYNQLAIPKMPGSIWQPPKIS
ncbi:MAG TPA: DUF6660 family protein [Mucilaginibacter sp.]|nr:DUF6660 family protein [Mucilaginibacter sp.]